VLEIRDADYRSLATYGSIPAAFEVRERVDLSALDVASGAVPTLPVSTPWIKNYDAMPANDPASWSSHYDVRRWFVFAAFDAGRRVGGAIVVIDSDAVVALGGRPNYALLWDLRVAPEMRHRGVGRALLVRTERAAHDAGAFGIDVETQDINVAASRLYAAAGYRIREISKEAYLTAPDEAKLIWAKRLPAP